jgi:hypothetical protein
VKTFTAQMKEFADLTKAKAELVFKQSAQDVFELAQTPKAKGGNMPVDTGFLRNSLVSQLNGQGNATGADAYVLTIAGAKLGDSVFGGWTADYALHVEDGTSRMAGNFFAGNAAQQWQRIVELNAAKARKL